MCFCSSLEGQKAFYAGEVSKLKAQIAAEKKKRAQALIARWKMHVSNQSQHGGLDDPAPDLPAPGPP